MDKGSCWSITINNPTDDDKMRSDTIHNVKWVKEWKGQLEQGENGTIHIQGMLKTDSVRFSAVKKVFPRAHIEKAMNPIALSKYVQKEETRIGTVEAFKATLPTDVYKVISELYESYEEVEIAYKEHQRAEVAAHAKNLYKGECKDTFPLMILDKIVNKLIREGKQCLEFMCSNPSFRTSYKTYFLSIQYRTFQSLSSKTEHKDETSSITTEVSEDAS